MIAFDAYGTAAIHLYADSKPLACCMQKLLKKYRHLLTDVRSDCRHSGDAFVLLPDMSAISPIMPTVKLEVQ